MISIVQRTPSGELFWKRLVELTDAIRMADERKALFAAMDLAELHLPILIDRLKQAAHRYTVDVVPTATLMVDAWTVQAESWHRTGTDCWRMCIRHCVELICRTHRCRIQRPYQPEPQGNGQYRRPECQDAS